MTRFRWFWAPLLLLLFAGPGYSGDTPQGRPEEDDPIQPGSFSIIVLPDTQYYHRNEVNFRHFNAQMQWIADHSKEYNIRYVIHLGDITQDNLPEEWKASREAFSILDRAGVPYAVNFGNHDYYKRKGDDPNRSCLGSKYFTATDFRKWPTFGGLLEENMMDNSYHLFEVNGTRFIIISLQWSPPDEAVVWADKVLRDFPDRKAIFVTHGYLYHDDTRYDRKKKSALQRWQPRRNDGEELWAKLLKKHPNVFLVLCGHVLEDGQGRLTSTGDHGNKVHQILCNYQMLPEGGSGFLRVMEFLPDGKTIHCKSYSPSRDEYKTDGQNQFTLELE